MSPMTYVSVPRQNEVSENFCTITQSQYIEPGNFDLSRKTSDHHSIKSNRGIEHSEILIYKKA